MPLKRNKLKQKAKLVVDLSALPHRHFHCLFAEDGELGLGFKDAEGNHWPQIATVEDDGLAAEAEPRVAVGCEVISINGVPVVGMPYEQAMPLMRKRPAELVFCEALDHTQAEGERQALPAALAAAAMRLENGQTAGRAYATKDPYAVGGDSDFFGFGSKSPSAAGDDPDANSWGTGSYDNPDPTGHVDNPLGGTGRFAGATTFDVEDSSPRRSRKGKGKKDKSPPPAWKPYVGESEAKDDTELGYMGGVDDTARPANLDPDDDIGGPKDTVREKHIKLNLGEQANVEVNGVNMYKRRQQQHKKHVICGCSCIALLVVYWISLWFAHAASYTHGCTEDGWDGHDCIERASAMPPEPEPEPEPEPVPYVEECDRPQHEQCEPGCEYIPAANGVTYLCLPIQDVAAYFGLDPPPPPPPPPPHPLDDPELEPQLEPEAAPAAHDSAPGSGG